MCALIRSGGFAGWWVLQGSVGDTLPLGLGLDAELFKDSIREWVRLCFLG